MERYCVYFFSPPWLFRVEKENRAENTEELNAEVKVAIGELEYYSMASHSDVEKWSTVGRKWLLAHFLEEHESRALDVAAIWNKCVGREPALPWQGSVFECVRMGLEELEREWQEHDGE